MSKLAEETGRFYAEAAEARISRSEPERVKTTALTAGYDSSTINATPPEAVESSFGCGNPVAFTEVKEGQTVLDLGCGAGLDLIIAAERVGPEGKVIGVDGSEEMLELAKKHATQAGLDSVIELRHGLIEELPVADNSVDWVVSNCVLNLSVDKARVFSEIERVLKPGRHAVIADLVADQLPDWVQAHEDLYSSCVSGAVPESCYLQLAEKAGLKDGRVIGRLAYDESMILGLIKDALPVAVSEIATRLSLTEDALLAMASSDLAGALSSVRFSFTKLA